MKKLFLSALALLAAVCLYATDLNIYASGLNATQPNGTKSVTIQYFLNAPATGVSVKLYHGNDEPIVIPITDNTKWAKGQNTVTIDLSSVPTNTYTWAIEASGDSRDSNESFQVNNGTISNSKSRGMTLDDNPESPYFGKLYISTAQGKGTNGAITSVSPDLVTFTDIVTDAPTWNTGVNSPFRISIGEDGLLYVTDWTDNFPNVVVIDRSTNSATPIFVKDGDSNVTCSSSGIVKSGETTVHGSIPACCVVGTGSNRVLYTLDEDIRVNNHRAIYQYNIGTTTTGFSAPYQVKYEDTGSWITDNMNIASDGQGGFWVSQYRWTDASSNPILTHIDKNGTRDYVSTGLANPTGGNSVYKRAAMFVNHDQSVIALSGNSYTVLLRPTFSGYSVTGVSSIATVSTVALDDIFNVVIDPARNIYILNASGLMVYATASNNTCETPAKVANTIESTGNLKHVEDISLESSASVELGKTTTLVPTITPADATDKSVSWSSNNESVATVEDGVVTGVALGEAVITATTTDRGYQATCTVTVYMNHVTAVNITPSSFELSLAFPNKAPLTATILPENATDKTFTWSSSDETIVTIDQNGVVTPVAEGTATIYATAADGDIQGTCPVTVSNPAAVAHISAWGLSSAKTETGYTFSFTTNMAATNAAIVFYDKTSGNQVGEPVSVTVNKGANTVAVQVAEIPGNVGQELTWAVRLTGADNAAFSKIFESANIPGRAHLAVDASPESPYMGQTYIFTRNNATQGGMYIVDQQYSISSRYNFGEDYNYGFMRSSIDENGIVWVADWRDPCSGIWLINPSNPNVKTQFFQGTPNGDGLYINGGVEVGGSSTACFIYGKGEDRKLFAIQEDFTGHDIEEQPIAIYNINTAYSWGEAPNAIHNVLGNGNQNNGLFVVDEGYWVSQNRSAGQNTSSIPALQFYGMDGTRLANFGEAPYSSIINGCAGSGFTIDTINNILYIVDGQSNILELQITYNEGVPSLNLIGKYYIGYTNISSMSLDYAGNLYVTAGPYASSNNNMKMVVFSPATNGDNTTLVPAKAADVVKPFMTLYEFGSNQAWATNAGVAMTEVEDNVFEKVLTFEEEDNYFTFSRAQGATSNDWDQVNAHRYGTNADGNYWVTNENINNEITLQAEGTRTNSFKIPAGTYLFRVNLNTMKFNIYIPQNLQVFEFGDNQGWSLTSKIAMKEVEGTFNVFKDTIAFTNSLSYFAFTTSSETTWSDDFKNARYGGNDNAELVDGAAAIALVKGNKDNELCYTIKPGTYEITVNFNTNKVSAKLIGDAVAVSNVGYATYYNSAKAYTMPENMEGYVFNAENGLELEYEAGEIVPMNVGLVLKAAESIYPLVFAEGGDAPMATNQLLGTDEETALEDDGVSNYYALSLAAAPNDTPESVGFYWMIKDENADRGAAFVNGAHKAYLKLGASQAPQRFYLFHGENNTTDILNVKSADEAEKFIENGQIYIRRDGVIYDATGRRVR